jgi:hypothetical protein
MSGKGAEQGALGLRRGGDAGGARAVAGAA